MDEQIFELLITRHAITREQLTYLLKQYAQGNSEATIQIALLYKELGLYAEMIALLQFETENGHAEAQYELANCYFEGLGVEASERQALALYEKAAQQQHPDATNNLADMYLNGEGTEEDAELAFHWFERAAQLGVMEAMFTLGIMCEQGIGVKQSEEQAFRFYMESADRGYEEAQYRIGSVYFEGLLGQQRSANLAFTWFERAAQQFQVDAIFNLGYCYENGHGVEESREQAIRYYKQAAMLGDYSAKCQLAELYLGIDEAEATRWSEQAAKQLADERDE